MDIRNDQTFQRSNPVSVGSTPSRDLPNEGDHVKATEDDARKFTHKEISKAVEDLNKFMESNKTHLKFKMHDKLKEYYVEVINDSTNEVLKEIPSKTLMDVSAKIQEMVGILVDEKM